MEKVYVMKGLKGTGVIATGVLISYIVNGLVLAERYVSLNPEHKGVIMVTITLVPFMCYQSVYMGRFYSCVKRNERTNEVYKNEIWQMAGIIVGNIAIMTAILSVENILGEAISYVTVSSIITAIFFGIAFLLCKPF